MTSTRFVVDIRRHRGGSSFVIEMVRRFCSENGATAVEWIVRPDQAELLPPADIAEQGESTDMDVATRIRDRVMGYAQSDPAGGFLWVLSYDNSVLMLIERLMPAYPNIRVRHIADLIRPKSTLSSRQSTAVGVQPAVNGSVIFPLAEAIELAKRVLRTGSHTSKENALPQKDLRLRMEALDPRAKKRLGDSRSVSLISDIVNDGREHGWVHKFNRIPDKSGTEALYLEASAEAQTPPEPSTPAAVIAGPTSEPASDLQKRKYPSRATEFEQALQKSRIGSMPETRDLMFDVIGDLFQEPVDGNQKPMLLLDLFAEVARRAQLKADHVGYVAEKNWPIATRCILRLMLWSGVLISEDRTVIQDKIGCNSTRVAGVAEDFRRTCEGFMTLHIIAASRSISYDDDPYYLGMTLYRRGLERAVPADELKVKADQILTYLDQQQKIEMDGNLRRLARMTQ